MEPRKEDEGHTLAMPVAKERVGTPLKLYLQPGNHAVELNKPDVLVGRHTEADMRLPVADVSRRHCRFLYTDAGWQVVDLGSMNGIYVNDKRVERARLEQGDVVRIGSCLFRVKIGKGAARQAS